MDERRRYYSIAATFGTQVGTEVGLLRSRWVLIGGVDSWQAMNLLT